MRLKLDLFNLNRGEGLSVALLFTFVFLGFVLEDDNLLVLVLSNDGGGHFGGIYFRARFDTVVIGNHQRFERNFVADVCGQFFHFYHVAFAHLVLFVAVVDDCVHKILPPLSSLEDTQGVRFCLQDPAKNPSLKARRYRLDYYYTTRKKPQSSDFFAFLKNFSKEKNKKGAFIGYCRQGEKRMGEDSKIKKSEEVLAEIYRNCQLALQSISNILPEVENEKLKAEITLQHEEYEKISGKTAVLAKDKGIELKEPNVMKKVMMWGSIKMNTMTDNSCAHIAEMMLQGTLMGITALRKTESELSPDCVDEEIRNVLRDLIEIEERFEKRLKEYL